MARAVRGLEQFLLHEPTNFSLRVLGVEKHKRLEFGVAKPLAVELVFTCALFS